MVTTASGTARHWSVAERDADTRYVGDGTVWARPDCGATLGASEGGP